MATDVEVIEETARAKVLLDEHRLELLEHLASHASAADLARKLDLPRQRINYHLRELEAHALIEIVEEKQRGNVTERTYRRTGTGYVISNQALGSLGSEPDDVGDRFSSAYQIALASRAVRELGLLRTGAKAAGKTLPTFSLEVDVRFATAKRRDEFAEELAARVADLVREYQDDKAPRGRAFRFYLGGYPKPKAAN